MKWVALTELRQIEEIQKLSNEMPVLIFKHSTRCSTSRMVLDRLERNWKTEDQHHFRPFFLDLIAYREISDAIASTFLIEHESPQVLLIERGKPIYSGSHYEINYHNILNATKN